ARIPGSRSRRGRGAPRWPREPSVCEGGGGLCTRVESSRSESGMKGIRKGEGVPGRTVVLSWASDDEPSRSRTSTARAVPGDGSALAKNLVTTEGTAEVRPSLLSARRESPPFPKRGQLGAFAGATRASARPSPEGERPRTLPDLERATRPVTLARSLPPASARRGAPVPSPSGRFGCRGPRSSSHHRLSGARSPRGARAPDDRREDRRGAHVPSPRPRGAGFDRARDTPRVRPAHGIPSRTR